MKTFLTFIFSMVVLSTWTIAQTPKQQLAQAQAKAAEEKKDLLFIVNAAPWHQVSKKASLQTLSRSLLFIHNIVIKLIPISLSFSKNIELSICL